MGTTACIGYSLASEFTIEPLSPWLQAGIRLFYAPPVFADHEKIVLFDPQPKHVSKSDQAAYPPVHRPSRTYLLTKYT